MPSNDSHDGAERGLGGSGGSVGGKTLVIGLLAAILASQVTLLIVSHIPYSVFVNN